MALIPQPIPQWETFTREERYFTARLFEDLRQQIRPFWQLLESQLKSQASVIDVGYEICLFRDYRHKYGDNWPWKNRPSQKQTFDLLLTLSNTQLVVIEAKAQQGFATEQLDELKTACARIPKLMVVDAVHLVGLYSSKYSPCPMTKKYFKALLTWDKVGEQYPAHKDLYLQADSLYNQ